MGFISQSHKENGRTCLWTPILRHKTEKNLGVQSSHIVCDSVITSAISDPVLIPQTDWTMKSQAQVKPSNQRAGGFVAYNTAADPESPKSMSALSTELETKFNALHMWKDNCKGKKKTPFFFFF